ncbi:rab-GTPase-TBC domain-domain-containing protein [Syncephalastrum racemosum]|uniref:Rab-GTPase-TBC domain-domain-containing protein n=1 Tax=Syncephalastrum racemosum TaxID=13706 RepID=A0A1X2HI30_SYNRA|nr:rab-GTPase-TBC domain-domain-containing protein [Syncephalastrum racemosum]
MSESANPQKQLQLAPEVVQRLHQLQDENRPVSIDEILAAANLSHLRQSQYMAPSKSAETCGLTQDNNHLTLDAYISPQKSTSMTLAERRRSVSPEKLQMPIASRIDHFAAQCAELSPQDAEQDVCSLLEHAVNPKSVVDMSELRIEAASLVADKQNKSAEFWQALIEEGDYPTTAPLVARLLVSKLRQEGIPPAWRSVLWQTMARSADTHLQNMYERLVKGDMGISSYERVIDQDLACMGTSSTVQATARLLKAYSVYDAHVGYCQGLGVLARPLLTVMPEKQAFCTFVRLMETYEMRTLYTLNMEGLHLRLHQFQTLLTQLNPDLSEHLSRNNIHPAMFASQWFLTLFASAFPTRLVLRMYDCVFAQGAMITMLRVAVATMQKHKERLLSIHQFDQLMTFLTSCALYENEHEFIESIFALSGAITTVKINSIAEAYQREQEQEKERAQQVLALRFNKANKKATRRESWFSWGSTQASSNNTVKSTSAMASPPSSPTVRAPSSPLTPPHHDRAALSSLHAQIEDLVTALSQLQKEHNTMSQEMTSLKMRELDQEAEAAKLTKRNAVLEKRLKKYKSKLAKERSLSTPVTGLPPPAAANPSQLESLEKDAEFRTFVQSLRLSGDFGALIAGALEPGSQTMAMATASPVVPPASHHASTSSSTSTSMSTSSCSGKSTSGRESETETETVATPVEDDREEQLKRTNASWEAKYTTMCQQYESQIACMKEAHATVLQQMQTELDAVQAEKEQIVMELSRENEELEEKNMATKRMASELQFEKITLAKDVERLEKQVQALEKEKSEYFMPRSSFSEEVFAAHRILFQQQQQHSTDMASRRHTMQTMSAVPNEYQSKYVESDLRCRELEKLLAEAKVKLAEYETSHLPISPRASLQQQHPHFPGSAAMKRNSTASLSMLASRVTSPTTDILRRDSSESFASSVTSATSLGSSSVTGHPGKRASMYARLWNYGANGNSTVSISSGRPASTTLVKQEQTM